MSLKQALKFAKQSIDRIDAESALEYIEEALSIDPNCYFAYVFQGKAYHLLQKLDSASESYRQAVSVDPHEILAWKGWFLVVRCTDNYDLFFEVAGGYLEILLEKGISLSSTIQEIQVYLKQNKIKQNEDLETLYLKSIIPGSKIGNVCGELFQRPSTAIKQLIDILSPKEKALVIRNVGKEKMKYSNNIADQYKSKIDMVAWFIYENSEIPRLYEMLINCTDDDGDRRIYEEEFLKYKYELLKVAPNDVKVSLQAELKEMVEGMVLVKHSSVLCWSLYFDWADPKHLADLDVNNIILFIKMFHSEPLATLLYAFVMSDISPFDKKLFLKSTKRESRNERVTAPSPEEVDDNLEQDDLQSKALEEFKEAEDENENLDSLSPDEILALLVDSFENCKNSLLAHRIIITYYVHLKEYVSALDMCTQGIHLLASIQRTTAFSLENTKEDLLVLLATIYTYHESPKNFSKALQIYNTVLRKNENNSKAKIGKGLILVEKNDLQQAKLLLGQVVEEFPNDNEALLEYSWCQIKLGEFEEGRYGLLEVLKKISSLDLNSAELRATLYYRVALSLIWDTKNSDVETNQNAFEFLMQSLKSSSNFAPSYTAIGILYRDFRGDENTAFRCFMKAFELDSGEIVSARFLVEKFCSTSEWDTAEIICKKMVSSEKAKRILPSSEDSSWPYRVLGCAALNNQDDAKAVEWFQSALRLNPNDTESNNGLAEAYYNSGRLEASVKVYNRGLSLDPSNWSARYMLGVANSRIGEFETSIKILIDLLQDRPNEECVICALYQTLISRANSFVNGGFFGRAVGCVIDAIDLLETSSEINVSSQQLWKSVSGCINIILLIQEHLSKFPFQKVMNIVKKVICPEIDTSIVSELNEMDGIGPFDINDSGKDHSYLIDIATRLLILSEKCAINVLPLKSAKSLRSMNYYNLGVAYLVSSNLTDNQIFKDCAIKSLKEAIQLESGNASSWVALGNAYSSSKPRVAQHCYIKASSLDSRDSSIWINLAALYLKYSDFELAQQAFMRAQSIAPDLPSAWLGSALVAEATSDEKTASRLFTHAFILSNGRSPLAQLLYGLSVLYKRVGNHDDVRDIEAIQELSVANFAMSNYLKYCPNDKFGLSIAMGIMERCNKYHVGILFGERLSSILEKEYEVSEEESLVLELAKVKAQLARLYLGLSKYDEALDCAQVSIDIVEDHESQDISSLILSSRVVLGLTYFFKDVFDQALHQLKLILGNQADTESKRIIILVSQILYARDTEETKQACLDQLFADVEENGSSLLVALTLGAICVVEKLDDYLPAIKEELESLSLSDISNDTFKSVPSLLTEITERIQPNEENKIWQRNAILFPQDYNVWKNINSNLALKIASLTGTKMTTAELSNSYIKIGRLRQIQRGLILNPENIEGFKALKNCVSN